MATPRQENSAGAGSLEDASASRYPRSLIEASLDPLFVISVEGRITDVNAAAIEVTGVARDALVGTDFASCFTEPPKARSCCHEAFDKGFVFNCPLTIGHRDSRLTDVICNLLVYLDAGGKVLGAFAAARDVSLHLFADVTDSRRREAASRAHTERAIAQASALDLLNASPAQARGEVEAFAGEITETVSATCGVARANVWLFNTGETELRCIDHFDAAARLHDSGMVLGEAHFGNEFRALKAAGFVAADDAMTDPRTAGYVEAYLRPNAIASMLDIVISVSGQRVGLLCLEHVGRIRHWEVDEIGFASRVGDAFALAISNRARWVTEEALRASELQLRTMFERALASEERYRELSSIDALTGIANRRTFDTALALEWARALRERQPISLIMADIDHFKLYNDRYGHPAGDICLQQVSRAIDSCTNRAGDLAARYGGEEFAVILPSTDAAAAAVVAERIRAAVAALGLAHETSSVAAFVTISVGLATMTPQQAGQGSSLTAAADRALYRAKDSGRNCVVTETLAPDPIGA
ncbi:MAG: diguanylate cyclase [Usitatibacter sp.]